MPINTDGILQTTLEKSRELAATLFQEVYRASTQRHERLPSTLQSRGSPCCGTTATGQMGKDEQAPLQGHPGLPLDTLFSPKFGLTAFKYAIHFHPLLFRACPCN